MAVAAVIVIAAAVTVPLVLARGDDDKVTTSSTTTKSVTSTTEAVTTSETATSTSASTSSTSTNTTLEAGPPGDSAGEWVQVDLPGVPDQIVAVALSDEVLLIQSFTGSAFSLDAYKFGSGQAVEVAVNAPEIGGIDVDGFTAVWWEGTYDEASSSYTDQHIYSYDLVNNQKKEVTAGVDAEGSIGYPHVAGMWITWTEGRPWDQNPEEYWRVPIYGLLFEPAAGTAGEPIRLAPSAVAAVLGDSTWTYSLSEDFLAWEQATPVDGLDAGTYVLDLATLPAEPLSIGTDAWRPSLAGDRLVYWQDGLRLIDLRTGEKRRVDARGDFAAAAPTFAAYFRSIDGADGGGYEIVARGFTGGYEQVLAPQAGAPWLSPPIDVSQNRVAFIVDDVLHLFEWKGR